MGWGCRGGDGVRERKGGEGWNYEDGTFDISGVVCNLATRAFCGVLKWRNAGKFEKRQGNSCGNTGGLLCIIIIIIIIVAPYMEGC